jgi:hypothetical protein
MRILHEAARSAAKNSKKYDSTLTREVIRSSFQQAFEGKSPYDWQVDITESVWTALQSLALVLERQCHLQCYFLWIKTKVKLLSLFPL